MSIRIHDSFAFASGLLVVATIALATMPFAPARADDDDWEDYQEALEDEREEAEERWEEWQEDREEALEDLRERGVVYRPGSLYFAPRRGYQELPPPVRYYRRYGGPVYPDQHWGPPPVVRYEQPWPRYDRHQGTVHAGPVVVHYGRSGSVHIGPLHVFWD
jgi:hypothetical protein